MKKFIAVLFIALLASGMLSTTTLAATAEAPMPTAVPLPTTSYAEADKYIIGDYVTDSGSGLSVFVPQGWYYGMRWDSYTNQFDVVIHYRVIMIGSMVTGAHLVFVQTSAALAGDKAFMIIDGERLSSLTSEGIINLYGPSFDSIKTYGLGVPAMNEETWKAYFNHSLINKADGSKAYVDYSICDQLLMSFIYRTASIK